MTTGAKIVATWALALLTLTASVVASDLADLVTSTVPNTTVLDTSTTTKSLSKRGGAFSGRATWYDVETWEAGYVVCLHIRACGQYIDNDMHIVALNEPMYGNLDSRSSWCGKHIMIANGLKTARAVIMDACPETQQCHYGALDMSMSLFQVFHDLNLGVFDITWWVIDGSGNGNSGGSSSGSSGSSSSSNDNDNGSKGSSSSGSSNNNNNNGSKGSSSDDDDDDDDGDSSSSRAAPTNAQQSASRAAKAKAASSSSASAVSAASKQEAEQSASRASVLSSKSSASASSASKASAASHSSRSSSSSSSQSSSSSSQSSSTSSGAGIARPGTGTGGGASNDDPQAGNLQNFVRVLNGMSMLVHAAAGS